jgi:uncharacterized repeat protein (TIGR03803 family)
VLYTFPISADGSQPLGTLLLDVRSGVLYGTTQYGGAYGWGTVFSLTPTHGGGVWAERVLYSFTGVNGDGGVSNGSLISDAQGALYGTTFTGGGTSTNCLIDSPVSVSGCGTVFKLSPPKSGQTQWRESVLHQFGSAGQNEQNDGVLPLSGLVYDRGALVGTTQQSQGLSCGPWCCYPVYTGCGTVYALMPASNGTWTERILYSFGDFGDGGIPQTNLVVDSRGVLYGSSPGYTGGASIFAWFRPETPALRGRSICWRISARNASAWTATAGFTVRVPVTTPPVLPLI